MSLCSAKLVNLIFALQPKSGFQIKLLVSVFDLNKRLSQKLKWPIISDFDISVRFSLLSMTNTCLPVHLYLRLFVALWKKKITMMSFQTKPRGSKSSKESNGVGSGSPSVLPFVVSSSSLSSLSFPSNKTASGKFRRSRHRGVSGGDAVTLSHGSLEGLNQVSSYLRQL